MYEVRTILKTLAKTDDRDEAMTIAEKAFKTYSYVEVIEIDHTEVRWYGRSVVIFHR